MSLFSSKTKARIAFAGNYEYNSGSSNTVLGYVKAGKNLGYEIRISSFGALDKNITQLVPVANRDWKPDLFVIVYESYPFLSEKDIKEISSTIPRSKTIIIDPDCKYSKPSFILGDTNHPTDDSYNLWTKLYDSLSDIILQPRIGNQDIKKVKSFIYFGIDKNVYNPSKQPKKYDLLYVGNNWYRWKDIVQLIKMALPIRDRLKKIAIAGRNWDENVMEGFEDATYSDPNFLRQNKIEILKSAPYGQVELTMSKGLLNPILVRPILNHLGLVTPRMFETFNADTVPLIPSYFTNSTKLYGNDVKQLTISDNPYDILNILDNYSSYLKLSREIRETLKVNHSYEVRLHELMGFVD